MKTKFLVLILSLFFFASWTIKTLASSTNINASQLTLVQQSNITSDEQQIIRIALQVNSLPSANVAPARVDKVAIVNPYALASVVFGEGGGMVVLAKKQGTWQAIGGGGGWLISAELEELGIPRQTAQLLLQRIDPNWKNYES
jgi:hypothetical protein